MDRYHPMVNFMFFAMVIGCSMFLMHPVCLGISTVGALCYLNNLRGRDNFLKEMKYIVVLMVLTALINPAFSHAGVTILFYLPTGNVLTLESIYFGVAAAFMLASSLMWFRCAGEILTSDKIVFLFGKTFPVLAMVLSMVLGFIPKIQRKWTELTRYRGNRTLENISMLLSWSLEDAILVANNMKGRGYGVESRSVFCVFRFTRRDAVKLTILLLVSGYIIIGCVLGNLQWSYYPKTGGSGFQWPTISIYFAYIYLCISPFLDAKWEDRKWSKLQSEI